MSEIKEDKEVTRKIKQELVNDGINISTPEFYCSPKYHKYRIKYLTNEGYGFLSYDYYIEKVILKGKYIKKGKYDIGAKHNIGKNDLKNDKLYWEIVDEEQKKYDQGKRNKPVTFSSVKSKFVENSSKGGLINQLKNIIGTDLKKFDKLETLKLLKLLYRFSKDNYYGKKINLMQILKKPSMENVDKMEIGEINMNGEMMAILKGELIKEIDLGKVIQINKILYKISNAWEKLLQVAGMYVVGSNNKQDLERLATFIEEKIVPKLPNSNTIYSKCIDSLFEVFYLKILQYECISKENDFIKINKQNLIKIESNMLKAVKYLKVDNIEEKYIEENLLKSEIENQLNFFVVYVFAKDSSNISNIEKAFILDNRNNVETLISWVEKYTTCELNGRIPWLLIVAAYQALKDVVDNKEVFNYSYYHAPISGEIKIISKVSSGDTSEEAFHWLWVKKVHFIFKCLLNRQDEAKSQIRIEKGVDTITSCIMMYNNIQDMLNVHNFIFSIVKRSFILRKYSIQEAKRVSDGVARLTGYKMELCHANVENLFKDTFKTFDNSLIINFCELIKKVESKKDKSKIALHIQVQGICKSGQKKDSILEVEIIPNKKVIKLNQFHNILDDEKCKLYKKLGLGKFIV